MTIGVFGTFASEQKERSHKKSANKGRYHCSRCKVKTNSEDVITSHIQTENNCNAQYYTDKELA